jgi:uracil-DNA glycosylase family 4
MGFLVDAKPKKDKLRGYSKEFLREQSCKVCPLRHEGKCDPHGPEDAEVYMLGEAPGQTEIERNVPFIGKAGSLLRRHVPREWANRLRYSNSVLSRPPANRVPQAIELECCRNLVKGDIVATRPRAVFGFGNVPLQWMLGETGIMKWNGRHIPVKLDDHSFWYFPLVHPSYVQRTEDRERADAEFSFDFHLRRAFDLVEQLPDAVVHDREIAQANVHIELRDAGKVVSVLREATDCPETTGFDLETSGTRPYADGARILTVAVSLPPRDLRADLGATLSFPLYHPQSTWSASQLSIIETALYDYLTTSRSRKAVHNAAFEMEWVLQLFDDVKVVRSSKYECTMSKAFILDPRPGALALGFLTQQYFGIDIKTLSSLDRDRLIEADVHEVCAYNGVDAKYHRLIDGVLTTRLEAEQLLGVYAAHLERIPAIVKAQYKGLEVDQDEVARQYAEFEGERQATLAKLHKLRSVEEFRRRRGNAFNPASVPDVGYLFNSILGKHIDATDEKSLEAVKDPAAPLILDYRHHAKTLSTYVGPLMPEHPKSVIFPDGRIHHIIRTTNTRTWRTAGDHPNTQNWVKRQVESAHVRRQIVARKGYKFVAVDFSGIQARNVAMESGDRALVQAFIDHYDMHADWRDRILSHYPRWRDNPAYAKDNSDKALRQWAKNKLVFPLFFGSTAASAAADLGLPKEIGYTIYDEFWGDFPDVKGWHEALIGFYKRHGYTTGLSGFRRYAPASENIIINTPIQSDESLLVLDAMARLSGYEDPNLQATLEIHDDLTFEIEETKIDQSLDTILLEMLRTEYPWINVPLGVEVAIGDNWFDLEEIGKFESVDTGGYEEI